MCDVTDRKRMSLQAVTLFRKCLRSAAAQRAFTVVGNVDCTLSHAQTTQNDAEAVGPEPAMSGKMLDKKYFKVGQTISEIGAYPLFPPPPPLPITHRTLAQRKHHQQSAIITSFVLHHNDKLSGVRQKRHSHGLCRLCDELHGPTSNTGNLLKNGAKTASREEDSRITSQNMTACLQQN